MPALRVGEPIPATVADAEVRDRSGAAKRFGTLWSHRRCMVLLLRHFGCVGCAQNVTELAPRLPELARAAMSVVLVGNGSADQLSVFLERHALGNAPVTAVTDPTLELHRRLGLVRSAWATVGPRALVDIARALTAGHPHRPAEGDTRQQGGAFIVDEGGIVRFFHRNRHLGDHAATSDLIELALRLEIESSSAAMHV